MDQANRKKIFYALLLLFLLPKIDLNFDFRNLSYKQFYYWYIFLPEQKIDNIFRKRTLELYIKYNF